MRRWLALWLVVLLVAIAAAFGLRDADPPDVPDDAARLELLTVPTAERDPIMGPFGTCPSTGLEPVRMGLAGEAVAFVAVEGGDVVAVRWPVGFSARLTDEGAVLVSPQGRVVAREGDVLAGLKGAPGEGGAFDVCFSSPLDYARGLG